MQDGFTFIDLFAGVGGVRIACESAGGTCVFGAEIDKFARTTYQAYFGEEEHFVEDVTQLGGDDVPDHDLLCAGFPCPAFSSSGVSVRNALGRAHGFEDKTKGTLFFDVARILDAKRPPFFLLENVKNLLSHDGGNTWRVISDTLREVGYDHSANVLNARPITPQNRERVFIVGIRADLLPSRSSTIAWHVFWRRVGELCEAAAVEQAKRWGAERSEWPNVGAILEQADDLAEFVLGDGTWQCLKDHAAAHEAKGNGFGYGMVDAESDHTRCIKARYHKDGSEALVDMGEDSNPRKLTPVECARLQGFPADFERLYERGDQVVSNTQAYRQMGNSVCVPLVGAIVAGIREMLMDPEGRADMVQSLIPGVSVV